MSSLNDMLQMFSQESLGPKFSSFSDDMKEVCKSDPHFFNRMYHIATSKNGSVAYWYRHSGECLHESLMLGSIILNMSVSRSRKVRTIQTLYNRDYAQEAMSIANLYSLESIGGFAKKVVDAIVESFKRCVEALVSMFRMVSNFVRSKIALIHVSFYEKNKTAILEALKKNGSKKIKYVLYSDKIDGASCLDLFDRSIELNLYQPIIKALESGKVEDSDFKRLMSNIEDVEKTRATHKENMQMAFFGGKDKEKPEAAEHPISDLLNSKTLTSLSSAYLKKLESVNKSGRDEEKMITKMIKIAQDIYKKSEETLKKDKSDSATDEKKAINNAIKLLNGIKSNLLIRVANRRQMYAEALSFRGTIYRLANSVLETDNKSEKK